MGVIYCFLSIGLKICVTHILTIIWVTVMTLYLNVCQHVKMCTPGFVLTEVPWNISSYTYILLPQLLLFQILITCPLEWVEGAIYSHLCVSVTTLVKVLHARLFLTNHRRYCFKTYWTSSNDLAGQVPKLYIRFWHNYAISFTKKFLLKFCVQLH